MKGRDSLDDDDVIEGIFEWSMTIAVLLVAAYAIYATVRFAAKAMGLAE